MLKYSFLITGLMTVFFSCKQSKDKEEFTDWKSKGDSLTAQTFDTLRKTLQKAISESGLPGAVEFCNTAALDLTKTYTDEAIQIKRTSDKIRNPVNTSDEMEKDVIKAYLEQKKENKQLTAILKQDSKGNHHYFKPILIQAMCLNCHGAKETQIKPDTWDMIQKKYPKDAAFDYKEGDIRGIWHLVFSKEISK